MYILYRVLTCKEIGGVNAEHGNGVTVRFVPATGKNPDNICFTNGFLIADDQVRRIFWNLEALKEAALSQPYISELAREAGLQGEILTIEEFEHALRGGINL